MMMPANYSAIAENEMTYVVGGTLGDILAPKLEVADWKRFNTNMVTLIGNAFMGNYIDNTLGKLFGGNYDPIHNSMIGGWFNRMSEIGGEDAAFSGGPIIAGANKALNIGLNIAGNAAAIYNLATGTVKNKASSTIVPGWLK